MINNKSTSGLEKSILSKLEGYCTRLALILQITSWACDQGNLQVIEKSSLEAAIKLFQYFKSHALKVHQYVKANDPSLLVKLISWIERNGGKVNKRDLYRNNVVNIRNESQASEYLQLLVQKGYGRIIIQQPRAGGHSYEVFILN